MNTLAELCELRLQQKEAKEWVVLLAQNFSREVPLLISWQEPCITLVNGEIIIDLKVLHEQRAKRRFMGPSRGGGEYPYLRVRVSMWIYMG